METEKTKKSDGRKRQSDLLYAVRKVKKLR